MVKSMTAFARAACPLDSGDLRCEIRSVNHRFLEPALRLPEEFRSLEPWIRERLGRALSRGKVDVMLRYSPHSAQAATLQLNEPLLGQLLDTLERINQRLSQSAPIAATELLRWPGLLVEPDADNNALQTAAQQLVDQALADLVQARALEGERLATLIVQRSTKLSTLVATVRERRPQLLSEQRERMLTRLAEIQAELDPSRLEQELALLAQRSDVAEELDRLDAHLHAIDHSLHATEPAGRRLDFLMQELNREANTLTAKSTDIEITRLAVEMKVLIEQMREQVQNIE